MIHICHHDSRLTANKIVKKKKKKTRKFYYMVFSLLINNIINLLNKRNPI